MPHSFSRHGESRSFPDAHALIDTAIADAAVLILAGDAAGAHIPSDLSAYEAVLVELGTECLGVHTGEGRGEEGSVVLGFARFRMGQAAPSGLVELVRQPATPEGAIEAARSVLEGAGLQVSVCGDFAGRIVDRLLRPYWNAALRRLDEGLATASDMDTTLRLGLGYPEGPIELLERTGLAAHHDVTQALFEQYGEAAYAPARRARVAKQRSPKERNV